MAVDLVQSLLSCHPAGIMSHTTLIIPDGISLEAASLLREVVIMFLRSTPLFVTFRILIYVGNSFSIVFLLGRHSSDDSRTDGPEDVSSLSCVLIFVFNFFSHPSEMLFVRLLGAAFGLYRVVPLQQFTKVFFAISLT